MPPTSSAYTFLYRSCECAATIIVCNLVEIGTLNENLNVKSESINVLVAKSGKKNEDNVRFPTFPTFGILPRGCSCSLPPAEVAAHPLCPQPALLSHPANLRVEDEGRDGS